MINIKAFILTIILAPSFVTAKSRLHLRRDMTKDVVDEMFLTLEATRRLKVTIGGNPLDGDGEVRNSKAGAKRNKSAGGTRQPTASPTFASATFPTSQPTTEETPEPTSPPSEATSPPTSAPTTAPTPITDTPKTHLDFDSTIVVICKPTGTTTLTSSEAEAKLIMCNASKASCREAVLAVKKSQDLQNYFGCAGDLGEGAARKLFNRYAMNAALAEQLTLLADTGMALVTERPDAMKATCMAIGMAQSPPVTNPCCQGSSGCASTADSPASAMHTTLPFMTVAITACTGDSACKDMGPNPLILDSSCTGTSACESMNQNDANPNPILVGITFVGEVACTSARSCEGVGHRSYGDVIVQNGACLGSEACNAAGRRIAQESSSIRMQCHIHIGSDACVGDHACKDAHSTVNRGPGGKYKGSLTIGDGGCAGHNSSCEKLGFSDRMRTDIIVPPGGCIGGDSSCKGCMTESECEWDEYYLVNDADGACPKGGRDSNYNPTGDMVPEYCIGKDTLPTDCPTFFPTPVPTPLASAHPTSLASAGPTGIPSAGPSQLPSSMPSDLPSALPSAAPSSLPSMAPSQLPSSIPSAGPTVDNRLLEVGCLEGPGNIDSTFNTIDDRLRCDDDTGTCAEFIASVNALTDGTDRMIKSIFGCGDNTPPQVVTLEEAQKRFNKIKNDASVTEALLATVAKQKKLFTGNGNAVTTACDGKCCTDTSFSCSITQGVGVMTVSEDSCTDTYACRYVAPDTIILESCTGYAGCYAFGRMGNNPNLDEVGYRVIGPAACVGGSSCQSFGLKIYGNVRVANGACNGAGSCADLAKRNGQVTSASTPPVVANVFVGENACQGPSACNSIYRNSKDFKGSVTIEKGACDGIAACANAASSPQASNDIIIKEGVCKEGPGRDDPGQCQNCVQEDMCGGDSTKTYTISDAGLDCPEPNPLACS